MPSGPRKRKSKRKNKSSVSPPHQGWLRTHMQMLKGPSLGNGSKGKVKNNPASQEAEPNQDRKEMDSLENEESRVSATSTVAIESEAENSQNADDLKMFQATENTESSVSIGVFEHSLSSDINVDRSHGLEEKREDEDTEKFGVDSSLVKGVSSQRDASAPAPEQESEQAAVGKAAEETPVLEVNVSAAENDEKLLVDADGCMETLQNGEMDANTPKTEVTCLNPLIHVAWKIDL
ncbi:hypothetical protein KSP40_PGU006292 [Platanthera guangdongensis]|uniref:Uncharacterized protein n=1 Tax=Platanthera guangdongensis TaxID=2320717 RepID=A0ABR2M3L7_9ASPA